MNERDLHVDLGERSYRIRLASLAELGGSVAEVHRPGRCFLVTNDVVAPLHAAAAERSLAGAGFAPVRLVLPDGEARKTLDTWRELVEGMLDRGVERTDLVVALGGGVTGDVAGFAAATVLRGLPVVQVPTTLLAMVDASVGGKTGVNTRHGKNLVGAFHQPVRVHVAVETLRTLPDVELRCGLGEVVKHAVLADPAFFAWLEAEGARLLERDPAALEHAVRACCRIKAAIVAEDEREAGRRALLNLGHTIAHALERELGYGVLRHGEAVGIGMVAEARLAVARGEAAPELPRRIAALLQALGLPVRAPPVDPDRLVDAVAMDKKMRRGRLLLTVPREVGRVVLEPVAPEELLLAARAATGGLEET